VVNNQIANYNIFFCILHMICWGK